MNRRHVNNNKRAAVQYTSMSHCSTRSILYDAYIDMKYNNVETRVFISH